MDSYDKIEELLLAEGYSKEEIPSIMVSLVEQGFDPLQVFASGLGNMLFNNKSKVKPNMTTTQQSGGMLGTRTIKTPGNGLPPQAPKPAWGTNAAKQPTGATTPSLRPGGQTPVPNFKVSNTPTPTTPRRNNLSLQRTPQIKAPSVPSAVTSTATQGAGLFNRLKSIKPGSPIKMGLSLAAGGLIDKGVEKLGELGGKQIAKGFVSATGNQDRFPSLYDKQGPNLSLDIERNIKNRDNEAANNAVYGQRTNEYGQKSSVPSSGDPSTFSKGKSTTTPVAPKLPAPKLPAPQKSARQLELDTINADKNLTPMQKWAKANPTLAAAKAKRDSTRGTRASTNPMLGGK